MLTVVDIPLIECNYRISDSYHTLYALSGLSSAQHIVSQSPELAKKLRADWKPLEGQHAGPSAYFPENNEPYVTANSELDDLRKTAFVEGRSWQEEEGGSLYVNGVGDRVVSDFWLCPY